MSTRTEPTARQLLIAAQRLAAEEDEPLAAALAGLRLQQFRELKEGEELKGLITACRKVRDLSQGQRLAREAELAREALERGLADGQATCISAVLKATFFLDPDPDDDEFADAADPMVARTLAGLSPEQREEYDALGEPDPVAAWEALMERRKAKAPPAERRHLALVAETGPQLSRP